MKTKWIVIIILIVVLGVLIYLNEQDIIHWQALTILAAALLGPFKFISSLFKSDKEAIDEINAKHAAVRERENKYQQDVADKLKERDQKIDELNKEFSTLNEKVKTMEDQRKGVAAEVGGLSIEDKEKQARDLLGGT